MRSAYFVSRLDSCASVSRSIGLCSVALRLLLTELYEKPPKYFAYYEASIPARSDFFLDWKPWIWYQLFSESSQSILVRRLPLRSNNFQLIWNSLPYIWLERLLLKSGLSRSSELKSRFACLDFSWDITVWVYTLHSSDICEWSNFSFSCWNKIDCTCCNKSSLQTSNVARNSSFSE